MEVGRGGCLECHCQIRQCKLAFRIWPGHKGLAPVRSLVFSGLSGKEQSFFLFSCKQHVCSDFVLQEILENFLIIWLGVDFFFFLELPTFKACAIKVCFLVHTEGFFLFVFTSYRGSLWYAGCPKRTTCCLQVLKTLLGSAKTLWGVQGWSDPGPPIQGEDLYGKTKVARIPLTAKSCKLLW